MKYNKILFIILGLVLIANFISAGFTVNDINHGLDTNYGGGDNIRGWINISFQDEPASSKFVDNNGNSITLLNLLKTSSNSDYERVCNPVDCQINYLASNSEQSKTIFLNANEEALVGFRITDSVQSITSINFDISSDVGPNCYNQLRLDFFFDGLIDTGNNKNTSNTCGFLRNYGCFDAAKTSGPIHTSAPPSKHCQRIKLTRSPGFNLGVYVTNVSGQTNKNLKIGLYSLNGETISGGTCGLPGIPDKGYVSCPIIYNVLEPTDYYVCVYVDDSSGAGTDGNFDIQGYVEEDNGCGFYGQGVQNENAAYQIFVEGLLYDSVGNLEIHNTLESGIELGADSQIYIDARYDLDCTEGCIIPFLLLSSRDQTITLENLEFIYGSTLGPRTETYFYDLDIDSSTISSDYGKLYLTDGNFTLPDTKGNNTFNLYLEGEDVISLDVDIGEVPKIKNLDPLSTAAIYPTTFTVLVEASKNITRYEWDFGDNNIELTTENTIVHSYNSTGIYNLKITITAGGESSYEIFSINVGSPKEVANSTIVMKSNYLESVKDDISDFPVFYQDGLNEILEINNLDSALTQIRRDFISAQSEQDYMLVMAQILEIAIPQNVTSKQIVDSVTYVPEKSVVDMDTVATISGEDDPDYSKQEDYENAMLAWQQNNLVSKITYEEYYAHYNGEGGVVLRSFKIDLSDKDSSTTPYFIIEQIENLDFKDNYYEDDIDGGYYSIEVRELPMTIEFYTTEWDIDFISLPAFISPELDELDLGVAPPPCIIGVDPECGDNPFPWGWYALGLFILIILGLLGYILLAKWYKYRYETHLFKNRNHLFNLITYIQDQKKKGLNNREVSIKLKKAGWKGEQVTYVMRKFEGKRTGMFDISLGKLFTGFKKKEQIPKRNSKFGARNMRYRRRF